MATEVGGVRFPARPPRFGFFARQRLVGLFAALLWVSPGLSAALADQAAARLDELAGRLRRNPADYALTYEYVRLAVELHDDEAAIGALERLLMFNPNLSRARKELGLLYARLGAYPMAALHLRKALAAPDLDAAQKAQIEAQLPEIEKQNQISRFSGSLQVGLRGQSNANYFPAGGLFDVGGVQTSLSGRKADANAYQLVQIAHDYDFMNQRGDVLETRASAYATQQFALPQYNIALFSGVIGPRFGLGGDFSIKPYATGAVSLLGSEDYLNAGGGGVRLRKVVGDALVLEPGVEFRGLYVSSGSSLIDHVTQTFATIGTGSVLTGSLDGSYRFDDSWRLEGRAAYSRASAEVASQSSHQFDVAAMLRYEFDPPFEDIPRRWTFAPYGRFTQLSFDSANVLVDPFHARRDDAWVGGLAVEAPVTARFGLSGHMEFTRNDSNISSFKFYDFSIAVGPALKF